MAVKIIDIPLTTKPSSPHEIYDRDAIRQKQVALGLAQDSATERLNMALNEGFSIIERDTMETRDGRYMTLVLYKSDAPEINMSGDDPIIASSRFLVDREV